MPGSPRFHSLLTQLVRWVAVSAVYYLAARLGLGFASIGESVSLIWPATGIGIAAVLLLGARHAPAVALGALLANLGTSISPAAAAGIAAGNALEALVAAHLVEILAGKAPRLDRLPTVRVLLLVAAPLGCLTAATIGVASLVVTGALADGQAGTALVTWWVGDYLGALVVAPVVLAWALPPARDRATRQVLEVALLLAGSLVLAEVGLGRLPSFAFVGRFDYPFLLFPFVIWAALRFGPRGATFMSLTVSAIAVWHASHGAGPFAADTTVRTGVALLAYLGALAATGLVLAAVDAEREAAQGALRRSEQRFQLFMENSPTVVLIKDPAGRYLFVSRAFERTLARPTSELVGHTPEEIWPPDVAARLRANDRTVLESGRMQEFLEILPAPDGVPSYWLSYKFPLPAETGETLLAGIAVDVTERVRREREVGALNAALQTKVAELSLTNHELEAFRYSIAHDLRAPLRTLLGFSDVLLEECRDRLGPEGCGYAERISDAARYLSRLIEDLLTYARLDPLHARNGSEPVDATDVVREVLRTLESELELHRARVEVDLPPSLPPVSGQETILAQVLLNLVTNAVKFVPSGVAPCVRIRAEERSQWVRIWVEDNGIGIEPRHQERIFGLFARLHGAAEYPGTGVGLALVRKGVERMGGRVGLESEPGRGSRFWVELPVWKAALAGSAAPAG